MSTYTIRPVAKISTRGTWTPSAGTVEACVSDASDATYIRVSELGPSGTIIWFSLQDPTVAAGEFPDRLIPTVRYIGAAANTTTAAMALQYESVDDTVFSFAPTATVATTVAGTVSPRKYTTAMLPDVAFRLSDVGIPLSTSYLDLWATIYTQKVATAFPTAKTETVTTSPAVTVTVTADIDAWQLSYSTARTMLVELDVKQSGVTVASGTAVITFPATAGTGRRATASITLPSLGNGTFSMYARAGRQRTLHPGEWEYGAWSSAANLVVNVPSPDYADVNVSNDQVNDRIIIEATPTATAGYTSPTITVERSYHTGGYDPSTFQPVRGLHDVPAAFGVISTLLDYEAERGVPVSYRVRVSALRTADALIVNGNWFSWDGSVGTSTITVEGWNIKCPETPALNMIGVLVTGAPDKLDADRGVFRPLAASTAVVVSGPVYGFEGPLSLVTRDATEDAALEALVRSNRVLLLESCWGWSRYIRVTSASERRAIGIGAAHEWSFDYVQTEVP